MAFEECLGFDFGSIGQQRDAQEIFLACEVDGVFEQLRAVTMIAIPFVNDEILQQHDEAAFRCADSEQQINHSNDGMIPPENKNAPPIRLFENQSQAA